MNKAKIRSLEKRLPKNYETFFTIVDNGKLYINGKEVTREQARAYQESIRLPGADNTFRIVDVGETGSN